jgi:hypothetical protein
MQSPDEKAIGPDEIDALVLQLRCGHERSIPRKELEDVFAADTTMTIPFSSVDEAEKAMLAFNSQDHLRRQVELIGDRLKRLALSRFLTRHRPASTHWDWEMALTQIDELLEAKRYSDLQQYLVDVATIGSLKAAQKLNYVEGISVIGIVWRSILSAIEIAVFSLMIRACQPGFQVLVLSSLAICYSAVMCSLDYNYRFALRQSSALAIGIDRLRQLASDRLLKMESFNEQHVELNKVIKKSEMNAYVFLVKMLALDLIAIAAILYTVL